MNKEHGVTFIEKNRECMIGGEVGNGSASKVEGLMLERFERKIGGENIHARACIDIGTRASDSVVVEGGTNKENGIVPMERNGGSVTGYEVESRKVEKVERLTLERFEREISREGVNQERERRINKREGGGDYEIVKSTEDPPNER